MHIDFEKAIFKIDHLGYLAVHSTYPFKLCKSTIQIDLKFSKSKIFLVYEVRATKICRTFNF